MAITPINNALIPRSVDMNMVKHQEDAKPLIDQQNVQLQMNERDDALSHQVVEKDDSSGTENHADARDEGKNKYHASKTERGKKPADQSSGADRVVEKKSMHSFDIRI